MAFLFSGEDGKKNVPEDTLRHQWLKKKKSLEEKKKKRELSFRQVVESGTDDKWELKACGKCIRGSL